VDLLTIGAFARACRLSPKALRLYDELGLLPPARVDPASGYRFYRPAQLERARLVAWLRRLGMPLARIRVVCDRYDRDAGAAADEIAAYWDQVVADTATRHRLAAFLVDYLSELKPLEAGIPAGDLLNALQEAVDDADRALHGIASSVSGGVGTTLTAMVWAGSQLALVHIGDTRAHLLRGGELFQITHDHSYVQSLVDSGSLTPDEAASHPQRAMLIRALDGKGSPRPDLRSVPR
jgi:protein phosphatase